MKHTLFALAACLTLGSPLAHAADVNFAKGADVGWVSEMEASGRVFRNRDGKTEDLYAILKAQGMDAIRLRVMIDFHYSDSWADPQQQTKPKAWAGYTVPQLANAVADHTRAVLAALRNAGVRPTWVQVGNETRTGLLWPEGDATQHMDNYARFVDNGMARGVFYWEPEAYDWKGYPMGAFDGGGKPTAIMDAFLER